MAALSVTHPTLLDMAKRLDPDNGIADIVEILNETNEVLDDMAWVEGNLPTGHRTTIRTGIPAPTWRRLNEGVQPSKSTTAQVTFSTGSMEAYAEVDKALADLNSNSAAFRLSEDRAHMEGFNQEMAQTLFYGNETTAPAEFTGLGAFYNDPTANNGDHIINGGSNDTDNTSIWLVVWGPNVHGLIPKGSTAGLQHTDKGLVTLENAGGVTGARMEAYRTHFRWDAGLAVTDWRYVVRIANIEKSDLLPDASSGANLPELMFQAIERIPNLGAGRPVFYMSRETRTILRQQVTAGVAGSTLSIENVGGKRIMFFQEVPVRRVDELSTTEAALTGF